MKSARRRKACCKRTKQKGKAAAPHFTMRRGGLFSIQNHSDTMSEKSSSASKTSTRCMRLQCFFAARRATQNARIRCRISRESCNSQSPSLRESARRRIRAAMRVLMGIRTRNFPRFMRKIILLPKFRPFRRPLPRRRPTCPKSPRARAPQSAQSQYCLNFRSRPRFRRAGLRP